MNADQNSEISPTIITPSEDALFEIVPDESQSKTPDIDMRREPTPIGLQTDDREDAWSDLGYGKPYIPPSRETLKTLASVGLGNKAGEAILKRDEDRDEFGRRFNLTGQADLTDEQRANLQAYAAQGREEADSRAIENGENPANVAARRRTENAKRGNKS
jgi:hypothetical protein